MYAGTSLLGVCCVSWGDVDGGGDEVIGAGHIAKERGVDLDPHVIHEQIQNPQM
jgi:hypothetical protein